MIGVVCQCGRVRTFTLGEFGATIESCGCGFLRVLRGRTLDQIAADESATEARIAAEFRPKAVGVCRSPAGTPECRGYTTSPNAEYCAFCAEERIRARNRGYEPKRRRGQKELVR